MKRIYLIFLTVISLAMASEPALAKNPTPSLL
jgi:hypothetical protein